MATVVNDRDVALLGVSPRVIATTVAISADTSILVKLKNGGAVSPSTVILTANTTIFTSATFSWFYSTAKEPETWISLVGASSTYVVSSSDAIITAIDPGDSINFKVEAVQAGYLDAESEPFQLTYIEQPSESALINITRTSAVVTADADGVVSANPPGTGTTISVMRSGTKLIYSSGAVASSYSVGTPTVSPVGAVTVGTPSTVSDARVFPDITAMATGEQLAIITYPVTVINAGGVAEDVVYVYQTINKVTVGTSISNSIVYAYKKSSTDPASGWVASSHSPGTVEYSFTSASITTFPLLNGWTSYIPSGTDPLYITAASASNTDETDTIDANDWSTPVLFSQNGYSAITLFLYQRNDIASPAPTVTGTSPTNDLTYTYSTKTITGTPPAGWSTTIPASGGAYLWVTTAIASSTSSSDVILPGEWTTAKVLAKDGGTTYVADLTNDFHAIPTDSAGGSQVYTNASTTMSVLKGGVAVSGWTYYVQAISAGIAYRDGNDGADRTTTGLVNGLIDLFPLSVVSLTADTAYIDIAAEGDGLTLVKRFTVIKNKAGVSGTNATIYYIDVSSPTIYKNSPDAATDGTYSEVTFTPYKVVGNAAPALAVDAFYTSYSSNASEDANATAVTVPVIVSPTSSSDISYHTFKLYTSAAKTTLLDSEVVHVAFKGSEGDDSITASLDNEYHSIPTDSAGNNAVYTGAETEMTVYTGGNLDSGWTFYVSNLANVTYQDGDDSSPQNDTGETDATITAWPLSIKSLTADTGFVDITAKKGGTTITRKFSVSKNKAGVTGSTATIHYISPSAAVITKDASSQTIDGVHSAISFNAYKVVGDATPVAATDVYYTSFSSTEAEGVATAYTTTVTPTIANNADILFHTFKIYADSGKTTLLDSEVIPVVFKGADGESTYIGYLSNDFHSIPTDADGSNPVYAGAETTMYILEGGSAGTGWTFYVSAISTNIAYQDSNDPSSKTSTGTVDGVIDSWPLKIVSLTADTGYVDITGYKGAVDVTKRFSVAKNKGGGAGDDAIIRYISASAPVIYKNAGDVSTDGTHTSVTFSPLSVIGTTLPAIDTTAYYTSYATGTAEPARTIVTAAVLVEPATSADITGWTFKTYSASTGGIMLDHVSIPVAFKGNAGTNGTNGFVVDLKSEADITPAAADGTLYTLPANNEIKLYNGATVQVSGVTYSVFNSGTGTWLSTTNRSGLTATVDANGIVVFTGTTGWSTDSESFTFRASYSGTDYDAVYTYTKSKRGSDAVIPLLLSETDAVFTNASGTPTALPTGNEFKLYLGGVEVADGLVAYTVYNGATWVSNHTKNGLNLAIHNTTGVITLSGTWTSDNEFFDLKAVYATNTYYKQYSIAKSRTGVTGTTGNAAASTTINNTGAAFTKNAAGTISPAGGIALTTTTNNVSSITAHLWQRDGSTVAATASYTVTTADYVSAITHTYTYSVTGTVNGVAGTTLTDSIVIPRIDDGLSTVTVHMSNDNISLAGPVSGYDGISFATAACMVYVVIGSTPLTYGAATNGFTCSNTSSGVTVAPGTPGASIFTVPAPTAMSADVAYTDVTITIKDAGGTTLAPIDKRITYALSRTGTSGTSTRVLEIYSLGQGATPTSTTATYQFSNSTFTKGDLTSGWQEAMYAPVAGSPVYMSTQTVSTTTPTVAISANTWSLPVLVARLGDTGQSNHKAYIAVTIGSPPATPNNTVSGATPTTPAVWSSVPLTLTAGQEQYQSDGTTASGGTTTIWGTPYPSYLKVANLSAIAADLGTITAGTVTGALLRTAASGSRAEMDGDGFRIHNTAGTAVGKFGPASSTAVIEVDTPSLYGIYSKNAGGTTCILGYNTQSGAGIAGYSESGIASYGHSTSGIGGKFTRNSDAVVVSIATSAHAIIATGNLPIATDHQFQSTVAIGTPPLTVVSTTKVTNLNADMVDGIHFNPTVTTDGATTVTPVWNNKPGTSTESNKWLGVMTTDGVVYAIPVFRVNT